MSQPGTGALGTPMAEAEFLALPEDARGEYVDGRLVASPRPTRRHQEAAWQLSRLLRAALPGRVVVLEWEWRAGRDHFVPDVLVTPPTDEDARFTGLPLLAVEVLSSDRGADLVRKATKYARAGLPDYWVVDLDEPGVTALQLRDGLYAVVAQALGDEPGELPVDGTSVLVTASALLG